MGPAQLVLQGPHRGLERGKRGTQFVGHIVKQGATQAVGFLDHFRTLEGQPQDNAETNVPKV